MNEDWNSIKIPCKGEVRNLVKISFLHWCNSIVKNDLEDHEFALLLDDILNTLEYLKMKRSEKQDV